MTTAIVYVLLIVAIGYVFLTKTIVGKKIIKREAQYQFELKNAEALKFVNSDHIIDEWFKSEARYHASYFEYIMVNGHRNWRDVIYLCINAVYSRVKC